MEYLDEVDSVLLQIRRNLIRLLCRYYRYAGVILACIPVGSASFGFQKLKFRIIPVKFKKLFNPIKKPHIPLLSFDSIGNAVKSNTRVLFAFVVGFPDAGLMSGACSARGVYL